jgi:isopentenyl-diphosphate delta-isomerase
MIKPINNNIVVLVNSLNEEVGTMEKMAAHQSGELHRAFSVFIFNEKGEMLIQKRADTKYHSSGLWSNACCSHPAPGENVEEAAKRRLTEEIFLNADVDFLFSFEYKAILDNGLIENELDHIFIGFSNSRGSINRDEVSALKFISVLDLVTEMKAKPSNYSEWFKIILFNHWDKISTILEKRKLKTA